MAAARKTTKKTTPKKTAVSENPVASRKEQQSKSVTVRRIKNGWLTSVSGVGKDGQYYSDDVYSATEPTISIPSASKK